MFITKMFYTFIQIIKYFIVTFFTCSFFFNTMGFGYLCIKNILDNTPIKDTNILLHTLWNFGTKFAEITKDVSQNIATLLFISNSDFINNMIFVQPYEDKYTARFSNYMDVMSRQKKINTMELITDKSMLLENTPVGNVIMKYDTNNNQFIYYSNRSLTTQQLQSIGRKFIINFSCPGIIQKMKKSNDDIIDNQSIDEQTHKKNTGGIAAKTGVMAKLKTTQHKNPIRKTNKKTHDELTEKIIENDPYLDIINHFKFVRKGKLDDISFTQPIKHPHISHKNNNTTTQNKNIQNDGIDETKDNTTDTDQYIKKHINVHEKNKQLSNVDKSKLSFAEYKKLMNNNN